MNVRKSIRYLVTAAGQAFWQQRAEDLKAEITQLHREGTDPRLTGRIGCGENSREQQLKQKLLDHVMDVLYRLEIVEPAREPTAVAIGTIVTYRITGSAKPTTIMIQTSQIP